MTTSSEVWRVAMSMSRCFTALTAIFMIFTVMAFAEVPNMISYQGRLTDDAGSPVADGGHSIAFGIYDMVADGSLLWSDTIDVITSGGLFEVLLGGEKPLSPSIFDGSIRYLGITVIGGTELSPRTPIVSVPYAMTAGSAGGGAVDCNSCDAIYVNQTGPETITGSAVDTALTVVNTGSGIKCGINIRVDGSNEAGDVYGIRTSAANHSAGSYPAYGGVFLASGTDAAQYGVYGQGSNNSPGLPAYGIYGHGRNNSSGGQAYGGYFAANGTDLSHHFGAYGYAYAHDNAQATGILGSGTNPDNGRAFGGRFSTGSSGTARHFGVHCMGSAENDSTATGVYGYAHNSGSGDAFGGEFEAANAGSGYHSGVYATAEANNIRLARGVYGFARNYGTGDSYGGHFISDSLGSHLFSLGVYGKAYGVQHYAYGVYGYSRNRGTYPSIGVYGTGDNRGTGSAMGGYFSCTPASGEGYGAYAESYVYNGTESTYGVYGRAIGYLNGLPTYGGYFLSNVYGNSRQYGIYCLADSATGANQMYGIYGRSQHYGTGTSYASYFLADSTGTGAGYGARTIGLTKGTATAYGITGVAANRSTGAVYGGYFEALNYGTGSRYGVYGKAASTGYAGYFSGNVRVTGDFTTVGTKSAAVKMDDGDYRLVYCQESPENWFEDFGEGRLVNGRAVVAIDPLFSQTANTNVTYHVFLTPQDEPVILASANRTPTSFEVRGPAGSNVGFSYRIVAKRQGYENVRLALMSGPTPEEAEAEAALNNDRLQADMEAAEQDRVKQKYIESRRAAEKSVAPEDMQ